MAADKGQNGSGKESKHGWGHQFRMEWPGKDSLRWHLNKDLKDVRKQRVIIWRWQVGTSQQRDQQG